MKIWDFMVIMAKVYIIWLMAAILAVFIFDVFCWVKERIRRRNKP